MSATLAQQPAMDRAVRHLITNYNPKGNRVGWLMMSSILVEAWDLYSISFVQVFVAEQFHPSPLALGLCGGGDAGRRAGRGVDRRLAVGPDRAPGHVPGDDDHVHRLRHPAGLRDRVSAG